MNNSKDRTPIAHKASWRVAAICVAGLALMASFNLAYMLIDRDPPIQFIARDAVQADVPQGGILTVDFVIDRQRYCRSNLDRWIIDSELTKHVVSSYTTALSPKLGRVSEQREITVPIGVATGKAAYYIELSFYCNILQRLLDWPIVVRSPDARFNVTKYVEPPVKGLNDGLTPTDLNNIKEIRRLVPELRFWKFALEQNRDIKQMPNYPLPLK